MASPAPPSARIKKPPPPLPTLTDDLLGEIFLHIPTPAALIRASATCVSFRRIITDHAFLRRFRALHRPPFLGFLCHGSFHPAQGPQPSAPLAHALASEADFSFSFVPNNYGWFPIDVRGSRVLLKSFFDVYSINPALAVCDPIFRRYVLLPSIPDELSANEESLVDSGRCLAPSYEDEEDTSFRVICVSWYNTKLVAFVFSSITRQWGISATSSWSSLGMEEPSIHGLQHFDYADGCLYWKVALVDKLLVLDVFRMEFSIINTSHRMEDNSQACVAVDREGTPGMLTVGDYIGNGLFRLSRIAKQSDRESPCLSENIIKLPSNYNYLILGAAEGFIFLLGYPEDQKAGIWLEKGGECYLLDVKTAQLKKVCGTNRCFLYVHQYFFGFPLSLSKPCV